MQKAMARCGGEDISKGDEVEVDDLAIISDI
jgi:hypothetical protein